MFALRSVTLKCRRHILCTVLSVAMWIAATNCDLADFCASLCHIDDLASPHANAWTAEEDAQLMDLMVTEQQPFLWQCSDSARKVHTQNTRTKTVAL